MSKNQITFIEGIQSRRGASVLLEVLRSEGVEYIFGNPGTTELPLMDALLERPTSAMCGYYRRRAPWPWPMDMRKLHAVLDF
jgi:hypothetical protein